MVTTRSGRGKSQDIIDSTAVETGVMLAPAKQTFLDPFNNRPPALVKATKPKKKATKKRVVKKKATSGKSKKTATKKPKKRKTAAKKSTRKPGFRKAPGTGNMKLLEVRPDPHSNRIRHVKIGLRPNALGNKRHRTMSGVLLHEHDRYIKKHVRAGFSNTRTKRAGNKQTLKFTSLTKTDKSNRRKLMESTRFHPITNKRKSRTQRAKASH